MIVGEEKTQDEVLAALKMIGFAPSKRAFQNQIAKWNFPPSRIPALKNLTLIEAVKELWKQHVLPAEMLRVLNEEKGFVVKKKELNNLRHSLGLYFRAPNAQKGQKGADEHDDCTDEEAGAENGGIIDDDRGNAGDTNGTTSLLQREELCPSDKTRDLLPTIGRLRRRNFSDLTNLAVFASTSRPCKRQRADSSMLPLASALPGSNPADAAAHRAVRDEADVAKGASMALRNQRRHRRQHRHTLVVGGGSKTPGLKYPSEMTMDEAKAILNLDQDTYRAVRDSFEEVCLAKNIVRKKGSESWQTAKDNLVAISPVLYALFNVIVTPATNAFSQAATAVATDQQAQALDILCMDVTKQMRNRNVRMSVTDSKKVLGLDPARLTTARTALTQRLIANNFLSRTESGEHWKVMRDEWIAEQGLKTDVNSMKAADVLCTDVMKRFNENCTKQLRLVRTNRVQTVDDKEQSLFVDEAEEEEHAKGTAREKENQGEVELPGGYISLLAPVLPHHPYPPSGCISLPLPLSAMAASSNAANAGHHPALSSATVPQQTTDTEALNAAPADDFQKLYPEIDPEILAMHG
ncbi:hypothetical protein MMC17_003745 [Xylographa soralifera]|nr:hypothetical protein [Xylographa soralifera]